MSVTLDIEPADARDLADAVSRVICQINGITRIEPVAILLNEMSEPTPGGRLDACYVRDVLGRIVSLLSAAGRGG